LVKCLTGINFLSQFSLQWVKGNPILLNKFFSRNFLCYHKLKSKLCINKHKWKLSTMSHGKIHFWKTFKKVLNYFSTIFLFLGCVKLSPSSISITLTSWWQKNKTLWENCKKVTTGKGDDTAKKRIFLKVLNLMFLEYVRSENLFRNCFSSEFFL